MPALNVLARLSELVYLPDAGGSVLVQENSPWTVFRTSIQLGIGLGTGYFGAAYLNRASREIVFAHRGMQLSEGDDVRAVLESNVGRAPRQYADAVGFYDQVVQIAGRENLGTFARFQTGHSLGGGLANLMGATTAERTVGFNAIGVRSALAELGLDPNAAYPHISNVSALYDPARLVGEPIGTQRDVAVSSIPFVPDRFEPLVVFGIAVLLKFPLLRLATPTAYGYSQHSIRNMVKTLSGLGATELRDLVPGLELLPDGQSLTGPWTPEWSDLTRAIEASTGLRAALEREQFNDALDLTGSQLRREQTVALEHPVAYLGSSGPDFMAGANGNDLLRGGASADVLFGDDGADRLFGNAGDDFLIGGAGRDTYVFASGDGADTVIDAEGAAALVRSGAKLALGVKVSEGVWRDPHAAAGATYARAGTDLRITFADNASDSITLKDFDFAKAAREGYLGIRLIDAPAAPTGEVRTFLGDKQDYDGNPSEPGVQTQTDAFGNTVRADGQGGRRDLELADRADLFYGSGADEVEKFLTAGGDDAVNADGPLSGASAAGGRDLVETGAGRDVVAAGAGDDWVEGGAEGDILTGNAGNDVLFADTSDGRTLTIEGAIAAGEAGIQAPGSGDILSGDAGDDVLLGSAGADLFLGGEG
ncbi:MAG TPA: hypothetical protein VNM24_06550, partial [Burkholderiales bacterium]|nr:hypothetical protein [Burkholderiales bacterium]